jgi:hypothetical protein
MVGPDGMIPGFDDGDGGLFNGILARYLADAAVRRPELAPLATRLVLASAAAAWQGRVEVTGGPVFAPDWRRPARPPHPGVPAADLSVTALGVDAPGSRRPSHRQHHDEGHRPDLTRSTSRSRAGSTGSRPRFWMRTATGLWAPLCWCPIRQSGG